MYMTSISRMHGMDFPRGEYHMSGAQAPFDLLSSTSSSSSTWIWKKKF